MDALGMTSRWVAAAREREAHRPDRLFEDPLAGVFAGDEGRSFLESIEGGAEGVENPYLAIRTRYLDDFMKAGNARGLRQIVLLAAGMDARAFRLEFVPATTVFEVDRAEVLAHKAAILSEVGTRPRADRVEVSCDLRDDFVSTLISRGFRSDVPALVLLEGLVPYLPNREAAASLLSRVASFLAPQSEIGLDMINESFLVSPHTSTFVSRLAARGVPWSCAVEDVESFISCAGFRDVRAVEAGEVGHGRWPFPVAPRSVPNVPRTYIVTARR